MTHLDTSNTSYGQKKGQESNWQFDSRPLKVKNRPNFLACRWRATYRWKDPDEGYSFSLDFILIGGLHTKLWAPKVARAPGQFENFGTPRTKCHLGVGLVARQEYTIRGKCFYKLNLNGEGLMMCGLWPLLLDATSFNLLLISWQQIF
jgi:hypothetical protein